MHTNHRWCGWSLFLVAALVGLSSAGPARAGTLQVTVTLRAMTGHLVIAPPGQNTRANTAITYEFLVHNTITTPESFRLSLSGTPSWKVSLGNGKSDKLGPLAPGETVIIPVVVTPPKKIAVGATGIVTLSAVTTNRPQFSDQDSVTTTIVGSGAGASLASAPPAGGPVNRGSASMLRAWGARPVRLSGSRPAWERLLSRAQARAGSTEVRETSATRSPEGEASVRGADPSVAATSSTAGGADTGATQDRVAREAAPSL